MYFTDRDGHLHVSIEARECAIPEDERTRMLRSLAPLQDAARALSASDLAIKVIQHSHKNTYHVEARLKLPGQTVFHDAGDIHLDTAFQQALAGLLTQLRRQAEPGNAPADRREHLERGIVMPQDPVAGPLGRAVARGDYRTFRTGLSGYEDWLRKRVGRWVQRYPEAQARVVPGESFLGDVLEEVYLQAFEGFTTRPTEVRLGEWLDKLIDPAVRAALRDPEAVRQEASLARTVRERPL